MTNVSMDLSQLNSLVATLQDRKRHVGADVAKVVEKGALNIKGEAQQMASGLRHAPLYPASITYDLTTRFGQLEAEIGPDKDRPQGALGNILEYGTSNNAPHAHLGPALDREGPRFVAALEVLAANGLLS